jgi:integrase
VGQRRHLKDKNFPDLHEYKDRHGRWRRYLRRPGYPGIPLPADLPRYSQAFLEAYQRALAGATTLTRPEIGSSRTVPGTIGALVASYLTSGEFRTLAPSTQTTYRPFIEQFRTDHGEKRVATFQRQHVMKGMANRAETPVQANKWLRMVKALMHFAIAEGLRDDDPTLAIKNLRQKSGGYHEWTEEEIAQFETRHPIGTRPRLAQALLLHTAQRRSDVIRIGRQHVRDGILYMRKGRTDDMRQKKTSTELQIPIHADLQAVLDATPSDHLTFIVTELGKPFTAAGFGNWFREQCETAGLKGCSAHGLRHAACARLADAGCTPHEIMAISGHKNLAEVERYTQRASQKRLAKMAMAKVSGTLSR